MSKFVVEKSGPLKGSIRVNGAKNAVLAVMPAALLSEEPCVIEEVPALRDVEVMTAVLESLGATVKTIEEGTLKIDASTLDRHEAPYEMVQKMRASFYVMGPLLARYGKARVSMPGGCAIGARPIDLHLKGFTALGAEVELGHGYVEAKCEGRLKGASIYLDYPSVGATANIMMAAVLAEGQTTLQNAAEEPEIIDLANFLNKLGANIKGAGTDTIRITGVDKLQGGRHAVIPDRIEAGTYMVAAAITGGDVVVQNAIPSHLKPIIAKLKECNVTIEEQDDGIRVVGSPEITSVDVMTLPYPGFPTDLQAQFMALMAYSGGTSVINETVFENRFMHVAELSRMGANIKIEGHSAVVRGTKDLQGAQVKATDLRAGAALIIAGMVSEGVTEVGDIHHIDRGYVKIEEKLAAIGAKIRRVHEVEG